MFVLITAISICILKLIFNYDIYTMQILLVSILWIILRVIDTNKENTYEDSINPLLYRDPFRIFLMKTWAKFVNNKVERHSTSLTQRYKSTVLLNNLDKDYSYSQFLSKYTDRKSLLGREEKYFKDVSKTLKD